jgi:hypothetical protein
VRAIIPSVGAKRSWAGVPVIGVLVACGSSGPGRTLPDPGPSTGLDRAMQLSALTPAQDSQLCDWVAGRVGGYGQRATCSNGDYLYAESQSQCMNPDGGLASCTRTVGDLEDCVNGVVGGCPALPFVCIDLLTSCGMFR